jgi:hypothetical protein
MRARAAEVFDEQGVGGAVAVIDVVTDGFQIYYAQSDTVRAASPADISPGEWNYQPVASQNIIALACDGFRVYALIPYQASADEIYLLNPTTGAKVTGISLGSSDCTNLAANGEWLVVLLGNLAYCYDTLDGTPVQQGSANHTAALAAVAVDATQAYIGGTQGTDNKDVRAVTLATQATAWSVALPTTSAPTVNAIAADGEYVYVGIDWTAMGGGSVNLFFLSAFHGTVVWSLDTSSNVDHVFVDDRFVYITKDAGTPNVIAVDKRTGLEIFYFSGMSARDCDGLSFCGANGNNVMRRWRGNATRTFMRADPEDPNRRPFHKYAVPVDPGL